MLENGKYGIIKSVTLEQLETLENTYNFEVEDYYSYYVDSEGILKHNTGDCGVNTILGEPKSINEVKINIKNANYILKRGWIMDIMDDAIHGGIKGITTILATNNMAYVYMVSNESYMIVDSVSYELVQLSKLGDLGWIPNPPIIWIE